VKSAAAEAGYVSNVSGSRLATGKTGTIAIVVPTAAKWFFGQAIAGAGAVIRGAGLDVLLYELGDAPGRQRFFTEHGLRGRADAVLVLSLNLSDSETRLLQQLGVPVAVLGVGPASFSSVVVNDQLAAESALRHLINLGHEVIGLIGIDNGSDVTSGSVPPLARVAGYRAALQRWPDDLPAPRFYEPVERGLEIEPEGQGRHQGDMSHVVEWLGAVVILGGAREVVDGEGSRPDLGKAPLRAACSEQCEEPPDFRDRRALEPHRRRERLRAMDHLEELEPAGVLETAGGHLSMDFDLPMPGASLVSLAPLPLAKRLFASDSR